MRPLRLYDDLRRPESAPEAREALLKRDGEFATRTLSTADLLALARAIAGATGAALADALSIARGGEVFRGTETEAASRMRDLETRGASGLELVSLPR